MSKTKEKPAGKGHNKPPRVGGVPVEQLKSVIGRIEKLNEEKSGIAADIRDVFAEAKGNGFCVKTIREMIKLRALDAQELEEKEALRDLYARALGFAGWAEMEDEELD